MSEAGHIPSGYRQPPNTIREVMNAPLPPFPVVSPTNDRMILVSWSSYSRLEELAGRYLRLAGVRLDPRNRSKRDTFKGSGFISYGRALELVHIADGEHIPIALPEKACPLRPAWSADGKRFAFRNITAETVEIWIGNGQTGVVHRVPGARLNAMLPNAFQWMPDQKTLLVKLIPEQMGPPPSEPIVPTGPIIQNSDGKKGQSSSYEARDTLKNAHDEELFDYYAASQLAFIDADLLTMQPVGEVDRYLSLDVAPDGKHLLVTAIRRPYSYVTTYERFPHDVAVWNVSNSLEVVTHPVALQPLADRVPIHGVPVGPRDFSWRANAPATLIWAEALDGGDWNVNVPARDKIMMLQAPFSVSPVEITRTQHRFWRFQWGEQQDFAILSEYDHNRSWKRSFIINIDEPQQAPRLLWDLSLDEKYKHPGNPVLRYLPNGSSVIRQEGNSFFLAGTGSSPDGDRPFLDRLDFSTMQSCRLFRSSKSCFEMFLAFTKSGTKTFLTLRESPEEPPNVYRRTIKGGIQAPDDEAAFASESVAITKIADPAPLVRQVKKQLCTYRRSDGVELSFTLYTPPGYQEGTRVPTILYAYPLHYADASTAAQTSGSQATFTTLGDYQYLLLAGYAIIDKVSFPVIDNPKTAYDAYMEQLIANAKAAVGEAVRLGVADPERIGVTGHSHGALMAVNLLAHTDLFRAGIASSGSYNKTLTPFGFQEERRTLWEAREVYSTVSPFFFADKIKRPLLLIHGADDANPGTTPLQSSKLYEAIRAHGGNTRLVLFPNEPHWYAARESNEHCVWEMLDWFNNYVKNAAGPRLSKDVTWQY
jgi:dipeptidyl aminopeptidase/acylaminoacyl peptidase